ncbi:MAG TPA: TIGR02680 family protein [Ktedonobacteraceae bacterium]
MVKPELGQVAAVGENLTRPITTFVDMLQAHAGGPQGYRLRRIILTNFWLYGQQEFEIPHGRLFLAGENASGKSTVLTAALPLGLDGDLRPNRLDTFGGRERRIEYYVLGGADSATPFSHERRTAYIALEFEWCDPDHPPIAPEIRQRWENGEREKTRFLTIGVSIAGNANTTDRIRPLRFLITDGSRLGHDIDTLYETGNAGEKRAYDHIRFKQLVQEHGILCDSQAEYERQVARYLFGYSDVKDFEKLINLLLVLRRPNLSTELNFSRVHDYLKMSLPKISSETTSHVIGTIERIDGIQSEIERIQEAYDAAERLHRARQHVALVRAQLTACDYIIAHQAETSVQNKVYRLRSELKRAERERDEAESRVQALQTEQHQITGQMKVLEASEGLQVATQITLVRERQSELEGQMRLQEQSLKAARQAIRENAANLERQQQRMEQIKAENLGHLQELSTIASEEALWETAAFQLLEAQNQVRTFSPDNSVAPEMPLAVTILTSEPAEERTIWLHQLETLHQQREAQDSQIQQARNLETIRFQELDEARRHFQAVQDRAYQAQHDLDDILKPFISTEETSDDEDEEPMLPESSQEITNDEPLTGNIVEQFAVAIDHYRQVIDTLESDLVEAVDQIQGELNDLHLYAGGKRQEITDLQALYEQKEAEPEVTPVRSERRITARAKLAEHGIDALPLYALLDFAPDLDENSAGQIEYMLEDAGLLDALVVPTAQISDADAVLTSEGLSDCRLDIDMMSQQNRANVTNPQQVLRFDTTLVVQDGDTSRPSADWQATTEAVLAVIHPYTRPSEQVPVRYEMNENGNWTHGLLSGHAGNGPARYIGKATRIRARQRELAELDEKRAQLEGELNELTNQLAAYEQQITQLQEQQVLVRKALQRSKLQECYAELTQAHITQESGRTKYQKARQQTQELRQRYNSLLAQLERESEGNSTFASDAKRVQVALLAMVKLKNQSRAAQNQLRTIAYTWEEYQKLRAALGQAQANESNVSSLAERVRTQVVQVQAELAELQHVAASSNAEELSERLQALRLRTEELIGELDTAKTHHIRSDERAANLTSSLVEVEENLRTAQQERTEKQNHFTNQLAAYPVEQLVQAQQAITEGESIRAAQTLVSSTDNATAQKESLEGTYREKYNALVLVFNREQPPLLEYGPDMDDQGQVLFLNENKSRPVELLAILSERIEMQKTLLGEEERQLFEDFLLQEIAEAIRTQILEAEEWVQQINDVLSNLPLIGEHYALQWKPPSEYDMTKLGSHLAQHYRLLRKPAQTLTVEETETLMGAFRREIEGVRLRQQENPATNFLEALEQVFDYREWFHFDVWVTPIGSQRQRLTDRVAGARSGAEQLFALYVPLFAALGALYRSASHGAPHLLALDEAFDKVSTANTQRIVEFLVSQNFQWIMTGPQVSGTGSKIPASARYLMIHEKGSPVATASASFWSDQQLNGSAPRQSGE